MKVLFLAVLFAVAAADVAYPKPGYPAPAYSKGHDYAPMPYSFAWAVKDDASYNDYAHQASGDDKGYVAGSYRVILPDGRTQIVNYKDDGYTGYVADVKYEGEAKYDYKPAYKAAYSTPAYKADYPAPPAYKAEYSTPAYPKY